MRLDEVNGQVGQVTIVISDEVHFVHHECKGAGSYTCDYWDCYSMSKLVQVLNNAMSHKLYRRYWSLTLNASYIPF
jgi:hypothetical protein